MAAISHKPLDENKSFYTLAELEAAGLGSRAHLWRERKRGHLGCMELPSGRVLIPREELLLYKRMYMIQPSVENR